MLVEVLGQHCLGLLPIHSLCCFQFICTQNTLTLTNIVIAIIIVIIIIVIIVMVSYINIVVLQCPITIPQFSIMSSFLYIALYVVLTDAASIVSSIACLLFPNIQYAMDLCVRAFTYPCLWLGTGPPRV